MRDKILVIDDEEVIRKNLKKLLILDGYEVLTAENGRQGLDILEKINGGKGSLIKVVLVDIRMPGMDGIQVLRRIKKITPQIEVIIITGHGEIEAAVQSVKTGAFDYIRKPLKYDELALSISRALERYKIQNNIKKVVKLFKISSALHSTLDKDKVCNMALDTIIEIIGVKDCSILIKDIETSNLELVVSRGDAGNKSKKSPIIYALEIGSERIGEIHINSFSEQKDVVEEEDREILAVLCSHVAVAIAGAKLKDLSITDGLTGLYNHRHFWERLNQEFKRTKRYLNNLCLAIIDIDLFKKINDSEGHQTGDFILKEVSKILKKRSRESDIVFRYGGDEFAVLLTNTNYCDAVTFADNIRNFIENYEFKKGKKIIKITVSSGITSLLEDDINNEIEFVEFADKAMLYAKSIGRNVSVFYKDIAKEYTEIFDDEFKIKDLVLKLNKIYTGLSRNSIDSIRTIVKTLDARDPYSKNHSVKVMDYSLLIAEKLGLSKEEIGIITSSSLFHDIGKVSISDKILLKKGKLTEEEYKQIKKHPISGINIIKHIKFLEKSLPNILHHHERYNGNGYPSGLKGNKIPLGSRIIAVADAFDAMISVRSYRGALSSEEIINELVEGAGSQFFYDIVYIFLQIIREYKLLTPSSSIEEAIEKVRKKAYGCVEG